MFFFYTKMPYYVFKHYSGVIYLYMFLTVSPVCMFYDANNEKNKKTQHMYMYNTLYIHVSESLKSY